MAYTLAAVIRDLGTNLDQPVSVKEMGILRDYTAALLLTNYAACAVN
jgi:hypothetical protein